MLRRVVGRIADERLRIDREPRLAPGAEHVAGVQVRREQDVTGGCARQLLEQAQAFAHEPDVASRGAEARPASRSLQAAVITDSGLNSVRLGHAAPEPAEQAGDHDVLLRLGELAQHRARLTALEEHCVRARVRLEEPTVPSPSQNRRPSSSCSPSMCGIPSFSTAALPSSRVTGATQAALTSRPSNGGPASVSDHLSSTLVTVPGRRPSHAVRSGVTEHAAVSFAGTIRGTAPW